MPTAIMSSPAGIAGGQEKTSAEIERLNVELEVVNARKNWIEQRICQLHQPPSLEVKSQPDKPTLFQRIVRWIREHNCTDEAHFN